MTKISREEILRTGTALYAKSGFEEFSIRRLAKKVGITHSVIYHYFANEEELLRAIFDTTNTRLGAARAQLPKVDTAEEMLKQRIGFQIDNSEDIVAVLKYYISHRPQFERFQNGFVPDKSALHMEEVLEYGMKTGAFAIHDLADDAKVMTHAVNGFLLEYYPHIPTGREREELITRIYTFLIRALKGGEKNG